jgi:hypothetical protein
MVIVQEVFSGDIRHELCIRTARDAPVKTAVSVSPEAFEVRWVVKRHVRACREQHLAPPGGAFLQPTLTNGRLVALNDDGESFSVGDDVFNEASCQSLDLIHVKFFLGWGNPQH